MSGRRAGEEAAAKARPSLSREAAAARPPGGAGRSQSARREEPAEPAQEAKAAAAGATRDAQPPAAAAPGAARSAPGDAPPPPPPPAARRRDAGPQEARRARRPCPEAPSSRTSREPQPAPAAAAPSQAQRSPQRRRVQASPDEREEASARAAAAEASPEPSPASGRPPARSPKREPPAREPSDETEGGGAEGRRAQDQGTSSELCEASGETDSFDEEAELLRCQADLVEAAAEISATSAEDELLTTDPDDEDGEDGIGVAALPNIRLLRPWQRPSMANVVIEEDEEDLLSSGLDEDGCRFEVDSSEIRSRLWAQSLLRLKRSVDEVYSLCEFESDEGLCQQVQSILELASADFSRLIQQLNDQQEYALLGGDYPFKSGVAWTSRTPRASKSGESALEQLERVQLGSPSSATSGRPGGAKVRRPSSREARAAVEEAAETDEALLEVGGSEPEDRRPRGQRLRGGPGDQLQIMVQSALQRVHSRLGQAPRKPSPEELQKRQEDRQRRAQQLRASQDDQKMLQLRQTESRVLAARERREERAQQRQRELLERMTRARRQYQDQLRLICQRARKENRKTAEVAFIAKEALKGEKELLKQKHEQAHITRALAREKMRKKLIESANRVAKVSENRRRQWETWQSKVQQELEEKERLASERKREHLNSIRLKSQGHESRSEMVRGKRRELQEEDERSSQDFRRFSSKHIGRLAMNCDGLPDGVREEVEQAATPVAGTARRSTANATGSRHKARNSGRCRTPPPMPAHSVSPKGSPKAASSANAEAAGGADVPADQALTRSLPALPSASELELLGLTVPTVLPETPAMPGTGEAARGQAQITDSPGNRALRRGDKAKSSLGRPASAAALQTTPARRSAAPQQADGAPPVGSGGSVASDGSDEEPASEVEPPLREIVESPEEAEATARQLEALRAQLAGEAMPDEEALRLACEQEGSKAATASAAHRSKISKLATDLGKVLNTPAPSEDAAGTPQPASSSVNLERADALLGDFCRLLAQFQREADYALVLKLGCAKTVLEICSRIKDSIGLLSGPAERGLPPAWRQTSNALLGALKWLGLMSKQPLVRIFLMLTNRVLPLADLALASLEAHFCAASPLPEAQSVAVLFLPQVLHVLSLHMKQPLPDTASGMKQRLVSHLLLCGLSEKLRDLLKRAEVRGMRLFEGASPVPLLLLRATGFLGSLVSEYHPPPLPPPDAGQGAEAQLCAAVLRVMRRSEFFGVVSVLVSILLAEGRRGGQPSSQAPKLPQTVTSLSLQAMRILNQVARIDLTTLQETLGACRQQELYHLLVCLLDYCSSRLHGAVKAPAGQAQDETELLHETIVLLGHYCLQRSENQGIMCYGEGQTLLTKITSLPLHYFMDERGKGVLFPTILATCYGSKQNLECLRNEMNLSLLQKYLAAQLAQRDDARPAEVAHGHGGRFPLALCQEALAFFSDAPQGAGT